MSQNRGRAGCLRRGWEKGDWGVFMGVQTFEWEKLSHFPSPDIATVSNSRHARNTCIILPVVPLLPLILIC